MRINVQNNASSRRTHEGGPATKLSKLQELERSVLSTLLWEDSFYESGEQIAQRISALTKAVSPQDARAVLNKAKFEQKLRHAPLLMAVSMAQNAWLDKEQLASILTRPDDVTEFLALYWSQGKTPISHQVRKGLTLALTRFDEYQFAKYDRDTPIKLRDVLRLVRPRPANTEQAQLWQKVVHGGLATPDTWEVALSSGQDKRLSFERLLIEKKLGDLAFIRNLRNMDAARVDARLISDSFKTRTWSRMLPFQFVTAARLLPHWELELEAAMFKALAGFEKLPGRTAILVDGSGSMASKLSVRSETTRFDAACGLAILARELCEEVEIWRFNDSAQQVPARHGFALRDALGRAEGGTRMWNALRTLSAQRTLDLIIVITDEQTADSESGTNLRGATLAVVNVAANERGVGYGQRIIHIDGWSENVLSFLRGFKNSWVK